jgi:hypothetical protein
MAGRAGTFASGQGMFEEVPPSRIVDGALAVSMGHIQNGFDIGPDLLGNARLVVPDRLNDASERSEVNGSDAEAADLGKGVDLEHAEPLVGVLIAVPLSPVPLVITAGRSFEGDGAGIEQRQRLPLSLPMRSRIGAIT